MKQIKPIILSLFILSGFYVTNVAAEETMLRLSVEQVSTLAIKNNFDIQLAKYDAWIKKTDKMDALAIYDTIFEAEINYHKDKSARPTTFSGTNNVENDYNIGLSKKLATGTTLSVDMTNERDSTDSVFTASPLTHESTLKTQIEQALGKNFFGLQDRGGVKVTLIEIENERYISLAKIEQSIGDVQKAYWDLVLQKERVGIEEDLVTYAQKLYDHHQKQLDDGLVEVPDLIASEANYKRAKASLKLAANTLRRKENTLKLLLNKGDLATRVHPVDKLTIIESHQETVSSLNKAFSNRQDYKEAMNIVKANDIQLAMSKNNLWPEINLTLSFARNGLGDHFSDSAKAISERDDPEFFAGVSVMMPLENRQARAQLKASELQKARALLDAKYIEKKISIGIIDQVRDCNVLKEVAEQEAEIAALQIKKFLEEEKRFNRGRSDTDVMVRYQEDATQARWIAAQAKYSYYVALIELKIQESSLLEPYWNESL